ncbi:TPA: hypothetical protein DDZ86_01130 [Candidatus Dependentiae bacterium]|nr:MAG: hypothetical protein UW09_C0004G0106 [candidate division TM6 bacterium GW2011_GWF2_43_87]HBL98229.1 hypothetical protein [Candidatus Dependentiae bacterium]
MSKSVVIIGGGISGLCAGCFAAERGYRVTIFEQAAVPGGLCTSWKRGDYTVDFCIHWLTGAAGKDNDLFKAWSALGAIEGLTYVFPDEFMRMVGKDGTVLSFSKDFEKLEADLLAIAPEDEREIKSFIKAIKRFAWSKFGLEQPTTVWGRLALIPRYIPLLPAFKKYGKMTLSDFGKLFKNPFLAEAFASMWDPRLSVMVFFGMLAWHKLGICGYPIGGSTSFARAIEKRFLELGGIIHYETTVKRVLIEGDRAVGVELGDGTCVKADYVISAADGHQTFYNLLEGRYLTPKVESYFKEMPIFGPLLFIAFGVNRPFDTLPHQLSGSIFQIPKTRIADREHEWLQVKICNQDPTLAPPGRTLVTVLIDSDYDYWNQLAQNPDEYRAAKDAVAKEVARLLEGVIPGIAADIQMHDVSTPVTVNRYTGNWKGSYEGWLPTPDAIIMQMDKTVSGLRNFYMVGQWVQPGGGLPSCAMTAREVVNMLCKADKK